MEVDDRFLFDEGLLLDLFRGVFADQVRVVQRVEEVRKISYRR